MSARKQQMHRALKQTPRQAVMFAQGEDLPLFTGQAPTAVERSFNPQDVWKQPSLIDLRPTFKGTPFSEEVSDATGNLGVYYHTNRPQFFYPLRDDLNNLSGGETKLPAGTVVRFVMCSHEFANKWLVATDQNLFAWTWSDFIDPLGD
jgi:hypothetical protein